MNAPLPPSNRAETAVPSALTGSRRRLLVWVIRVIPAVMGVGLLIPLIGYISAPALTRRKDAWATLGHVQDLPAGEPQELEYTQALKDGWRTTVAKKAVWIVKQSNGAITAFSPACPHLGCGYRWDGQDRKFKCPCHGSVYDMAGKVLSGPAPRRLDVLPTKVEKGELLVMDKKFKSGLAQSVEL